MAPLNRDWNTGPPCTSMMCSMELACGNARKKMWRMSKVKWVIITLPNKYFLDLGLLLPGN